MSICNDDDVDDVNDKDEDDDKNDDIDDIDDGDIQFRRTQTSDANLICRVLRLELLPKMHKVTFRQCVPPTKT